MSLARRFLLFAIGLPLCTSIVAQNTFAVEALNVLLVTSDDLGLQLSCYGNKVIKTPNLDALAVGGVQFEVAYVAQASCSPSRSAMFTGTFPHTNGQIGLANRGFAMHEKFHDRTLPHYLKTAGYRTGIIGKLHVAPEAKFPFDFRPKVNTRVVRDVAKLADEFLTAKSEQPFFLMVNYSDPHAYRTSRQSRDWFFQRQVDGLPKDPLDPGDAPAWPYQGIATDEQLKKVANYYNCVRRLDDGIGMLLALLERHELTESTLVLFVGDHGPPFARGKTTCYEAGLRVPFIVRWPGVSQPHRSKAMVSTVDIVPTVLDAAGVKVPEDLHGVSLRSVLEKEDAPWREYLAAEFHFHGSQPFYPRRAIRDTRYKLIHNLRAGSARPSTGIDGDKAMDISQAEKYRDTPYGEAFRTFAHPPEFELYDLNEDPNELTNLAGREGLAEVQTELREALHKWRRDTQDPFLDSHYLQEVARSAK